MIIGVVAEPPSIAILLTPLIVVRVEITLVLRPLLEILSVALISLLVAASAIHITSTTTSPSESIAHIVVVCFRRRCLTLVARNPN